MMKRAFSSREKILLLILVFMVLGLLYYVAVYQKIAESISAAQVKTQTTQTELAVELVKLQNMSAMQAALDGMQASGKAAVAEIPDYDNIQLLMKELNSILSAATSYNITFSTIDFTEGLARRPVTMTFAAKDYATAKSILADLSRCKYRSILGSLRVSGSKNVIGSGEVKVGMDLTFYEMYKIE